MTLGKGQFLRDAAVEAWRPKEVPHSKEWEDTNFHHKEYARWHDWVRRVLEECCWWELNGGGKNINSHLQVRLTNLYLNSLTHRTVGDQYLRIPNAKMVDQEGREPRERTWEQWYDKRSRDADLWYKHWTSHIIAASFFGVQSNTRTQRIRDMWQLFKNRR